jgi:hypothetical protein
LAYGQSVDVPIFARNLGDKRNFMAKATLGLFDGSSRKAETYMGWNRQSVEVGLHELHTGIICMDNYYARGNKKTEEKLSAQCQLFFNLDDNYFLTSSRLPFSSY